jgi:MOSC domain-containing protein YiiM
MYNERKNETPGLMEALWDAGGVSCEVLEGGTISIGDAISVHPNTEGYRIDPGHRSNGFFTRPSKRTAEMVREALEEKKTIYKDLIDLDPVGVNRAQASYESVGLSFWPKSHRAS